MQSYVEYIHQKYPKPVFSEVYYLGSNGAGIASVNYSQEGARCIFIQYLYWTTNAGGGSIIFTDQYANLIFQLNNAINFSGWSPIFAVKNGQQILIKSSVAAIPFSISYQYVM